MQKETSLRKDWKESPLASFLLHRITRNVIFWLILAALPIWLNWDNFGSAANFYTDLLFYLEVAFLGYFNNLLLIPRLMDRGKVTTYFITIFLLVLFVAYLGLFWFTPLVSDYTSRLSRPWMAYLYNLDNFFFFVGSFTGAALLTRLAKEQSNSRRLAALQEETELAFLKAQINPHFLFNTLNMLYSYALENSKRMPEMMLGLANAMRYALQEGQANKVPLATEIQFLEDYVALQSLRLEDRAQISFIDETGDNNFHVAPLLLIVLVENAFKYATSHQIKSIQIDIQLRLVGRQLNFRVSNSTPEEAVLHATLESCGIGLSNLRKRLRLIYRKAASLQTERKGKLFIAELILPLDELPAPAVAPLNFSNQP